MRGYKPCKNYRVGLLCWLTVTASLLAPLANAESTNQGRSNFEAPPNPAGKVIEAYGKLMDKTILRSSSVSPLPESMLANLPADKGAAIAEIESVLASRGDVVVQDGPHFVRIFPTNLSSFLTNAPLRGAELASRNPQVSSNAVGGKANDNSRMPTGMVDFRNADIKQAINIFGMLAGRMVIAPDAMTGPPIELVTYGMLTTEEGVYALATTLALNGFLVANDGEKIVQIVPASEQLKMVLKAPQPETNAPLLKPNGIPRMGGGFALPTIKAPQTELAKKMQRLQQLYDNFMHHPNPTERQAGRLLEFYAELTDKTAQASTPADDGQLRFQVEMPMTREELVYAIERTFVVNHFTIVAVDEKTIKLTGGDPTAFRVKMASRPPLGSFGATPRTNHSPRPVAPTPR